MPWNDNSNSGGKPGPKPGGKGRSSKPGPWGAPTGGSGGGGSDGPRETPPKRPASGGAGPAPPDFNQMSRRVADQVRGYFGGGAGGGGLGGGLGSHGSGPKIIGAIVAAIAGLWILSGIYFVQPSEKAVITTFGAYSGQASPGPNYHLPWPIQSVTKVAFTTLNQTTVGGDDNAPQLDESLMLTGDQNIVDLKFTVQWRVQDAYRYLFALKDTDAMVKSAAESAMREVVGRTDLQTIITNGQGQVQLQTAKLMQRLLNSYNAGVYVDEVQIKSANSPPKVIDAFREVARAKQEADATVNNARGRAAQVKQQALGYKAQVVQEAQGEAARFDNVYAQYKEAPAVTRQRMYIETMERVLKSSNNIIIDSKSANIPLVLTPDALKAKGMDAVVTPQAARQ